MRIAVIVNPISGPRRGRLSPAERRSLVRTHLARPGTQAEVAVTRARGHATELSADYARRGFDVVVAWGGDGTINEVAGPLLGTATALGIVAAGSGDGLARSLGLALPPDRALAMLEDAPREAIDVGRFGARHFLNIAGVGFDAAVARVFDAKGRRGVAGYLAIAGRLIWTYRPVAYDLCLDGVEEHGPRFLVAFANGREYGNRLVLAAEADPADGWLDAVVVADGAPVRQAWRARRLAVGVGRPAQGIARSRVRQASIEGTELVCHVDGEPFTKSGRIDVTIEPAALRVAGRRVGSARRV